jgi:hypothetical protein
MRRNFRFKSPKTLWILLTAGIVAVVLVTPPDTTGSTGFRPSSHNIEPGGASGFYEVASRLGWPVTRRESSDLDLKRGVFVSLNTPQQLTATEVHSVLDQVRQGAGLLVSAPVGSAIADSLGLGEAWAPGTRAPVSPAVGRCPPARGFAWLTQPDLLNIDHLRPIRKSPLADSAGERLLPLLSPDVNHTISAARGIRYGAGRIVAMTDPTPLVNDVFRECALDASVASIRVLEFLSDGRRPRLVFDEYRHGYGHRDGRWSAMTSIFTDTGSGRGLLQLLAAGLILLLAVGPRPLPPRATTTIERRSPFEHVSALAAAYTRAGATRLATRKLVKGLRRRMPGAVTSGQQESDELFLVGIPAMHPELASDVARVRAALAAQTAAADLLAVGKSIENIERSLKA